MGCMNHHSFDHRMFIILKSFPKLDSHHHHSKAYITMYNYKKIINRGFNEQTGCLRVNCDKLSLFEHAVSWIFFAIQNIAMLHFL